MSGSKYNNSGFGLSLSGSQVGTPVSSGRQQSGRSSARGSQSSLVGTGAREKTTEASKGRPRSSSFDRQVPKFPSTRGSTKGSARGTPRQNGSSSSAATAPATTEDFLALFDTTTQPKILQPKSKPMGKGSQPKKAWGSAQNSARSGTSATSKQSRTTSKFSHSVFEPVSARTNSTVDDEDEAYQDGDYLHTNYEQNPAHSSQDSKYVNRNRTTPRDRGDHNLHLAIPVSGGRSSAHSENNLVHNSQYDSSDKATKLNSIANNIALSPSTKAPFQGMENSCQNIKHKLVNQVQQPTQSNKGAVGRNVAEDYIKKCNMAATQIQRWYRRHNNLASSKAGEAALRRLLQSKKKERTEEMERDLQNPKEERKRTREERAHQARLEAIEELQKKREAKRQQNQQLVEQEMKFLHESGKVSKTPSNKSNVKKKPSPKAKSSPGSARKDEETMEVHVQSLSPRSPLPEAQAEDSVKQENRQEAEAPSQIGTKTTIDDLMETLKQLEAEDHLGKASSRKEKNEKPLAWLDELEKNSNAEDNANEGDVDMDKDNIKKSGFLSDEKLRNVMNYLDEVDAAERLSEIDQELSKSAEALFNPPLLVPSQDELAAIQQASVNAAQVTNSMLTQKMELEEKRRTVQMLQKALSQQRELTVRHAKETEKEMKKRLHVQKDEYENTIKGHVGFIDQLIDDKKSLTEKCESLVMELKTVDKKYKDKMKTMTDHHAVELKRLKDTMAAAEKLRREKWIKEKTTEIHQITIKGMEPEVVAIANKYKKEIQTLKSIHEAELLASDERAGGRYARMIEELRDQLAKEKEAACARERELARQTYEKQMHQEEERYQQQRSRLYAEVQEEKNRLAQQATRQRTEHDKLQRQLEDSQSAALAAMRDEFAKSRDDQERRHSTEIKQLQDQIELEKAAWEENLLKKQQTWALQKERELKESVRKERDREIELVIKRLEEDNQASREECERVADNRIKRIRDKYESEMAELERSERLTMEKYNQNKASLAELEGENERHKVTMRQKDKEVDEIKKLLDKLNNERDHVSDVIRQEFADRIVATEEENKRIKNDMSELKARHRLEVEKSKTEVEIVIKQKEEEMEEVHKRVKQAILKKEDVVNQIKQQYQAAVKRADHLEGLLEQQRKQLLGKK